MGCGISTMDATEDASKGPSRHHSNRVRIAPPVVENKKYCDSDDDGVVMVNEETKKKGEGLNDGRLKEKSMVDRKEGGEERVVFFNESQGGKEEHVIKHVKTKKEENYNEDYNDDGFIGRGSPSFRDYCNDYNFLDQSSMGDSNDCDSRESTKHGSSDEDSTNQLRNEKNINSTKEPKKKERRGRGFRNVMNTGKPRGKRNLLNFACYNSSTESYADASFNKIVEKTT